MLELLGAIGGIVLVDLVLSGDNALVIGAAAARLPRRERWLAILIGGGGAVVLRILFAIVATLLLIFPLLQALGGALLLYIAIHLLMDRLHHPESTQPAGSDSSTQARAISREGRHSLWQALLTIIIADATMSLDNVIAVGALAHGNLLLLVAGILLSLLILLFGSALVAELIGRLPWLLDVAALVLGWTAGHMILGDLRLGPFLKQAWWSEYAVYACCLGLVLAVDIALRLRARRQRSLSPSSSPSPSRAPVEAQPSASGPTRDEALPRSKPDERSQR
ncbi:MAG: YjbE family putative metal transport protein [Thermogemmatispora sp.]|uniref:YjbE family putative metal transport protein n=1 Tax=Thermogemmatispora sp. TaxID=1968838 RepID=UPI0019F7F6D9|nr:YjbE family putative metal transport protein [Thermogemmatispora sp.]MBE3565131.1 YjbE family putative metal transport protein [Thermogemmatispora sp.]